MNQFVHKLAVCVESEDLFRKIYNNSNDAIFIIDPKNDKIIEANPRASDMLQYPRVELLGMAISAVHPQEMPELLAFTDRVLAHGNGWTNELSCLTKSGTQLPAEISASSIEIKGRPYIIAMVRDIRERKETEKALMAVQAELRKRALNARHEAELALVQLKRQHELILHAAGDGIYGIDHEGKGTFANPAAIEMLGWTLDEIIGQPVHRIHHHTRPDGSPYPREACPIYAACKDGKVHSCDNEVFWHKNGTSIPVEYTSTPIQEGDKVTGAVVVFRDITERKLAEATLRRLQDKERLAAVGEFAATIAHEVRNPLSTIAMALDYLNNENQSSKAQKRLNLAASEVQRLERLLSELLLFAKPHQLIKRALDLNDLIKEILDNQQDAPPAEQRAFSYTAPPQPLIVIGDEDKLKQVLINLLANACQATRPNEKITINVNKNKADDIFVIEVVNPGLIAAHIMNRITEPFFTTKSKGTGLGLAIVKRIVEAHEGEFSIRSDESLGVVASVSLPMTARPNKSISFQ